MAKEKRVDVVLGAKDRASKVFGGFAGKVIALNQGIELMKNAFRGAASALDTLVTPMANFEQEMANVRTLIDVTAGEFENLEKGVLKIGKSSPKALGDLTKATYDLISAGVSHKDALWALNEAQKASIAGSTGITEAVNGAMATINAFQLPLSELTHVFDLQFNTVKAGVITFQQLASTIGRALPAAKNLGVSLDEVYAGMATITKGGFSAEEAATALNQAFIALADPNIQANLRELGIEVFDEMTGKFKGMPTLIEEVRTKTMGMSDAQRSAFFGIMGLQDRAARGFMSMVNQYEGYQETLGDMSQVGAMTEAHKKMAATILNQWKTVKNRFSTRIMEMVERYKDWILKAIAGADVLVRNLDSIFNVIFGIAKAITGAFRIVYNAIELVVNAIVGGISYALNYIFKALEGVASGIGKVFEWLGKENPLQGFMDAMDSASGQAERFSSNIFGDLGTDINDIVAGWETLSGGIGTVVDQADSLKAAYQAVADIFNGIRAAVIDTKTELGTAPESMEGFIGPMPESMEGFIGPMPESMEGFIGPMQEAAEAVRILTDEEIADRERLVDKIIGGSAYAMEMKLKHALTERIKSGQYTNQQLADYAKAIQKKIALARGFENIANQTFDRLTNAMVEMMTGGQADLREIFKNMAKDFLKLFIEQILRDVKLALVAKLISLLKFFDVRANDLMAIQMGRDYARYFQQGVFEGLNTDRLAGSMARMALPAPGGAMQIGAAIPASSVTVIIQGNVIGEDEYVKEHLIPAIEAAVTRKESNLAVI